MPKTILLLLLLFLYACSQPEGDKNQISQQKSPSMNISLDLDEANRLAELPLACINTPLPYKSGHTISREEELEMPQVHHPAFYGCFDWHSAVHGHWSLVYLMKLYPQLTATSTAREKINANLTKENIEQEIKYFSLNKYTQSFERTYGWAWVLKLQEELHTWNDPDAKRWAENLLPLTDHISKQYIEYLPKLVYPIRVGEHSNTAFGLSFAYDYARTVEDKPLMSMIEESAMRFYSADAGCPITWEPSGYDFLSPCLQEIDIMRKILPLREFDRWLSDFLPDLANQNLTLEPGRIIDRSDGKLVHLDGLNFSRAWCLYPLKGNENAARIADQHLKYSLDKITDGDYAGQHWLASFALYAFKQKGG